MTFPLGIKDQPNQRKLLVVLLCIGIAQISPKASEAPGFVISWGVNLMNASTNLPPLDYYSTSLVYVARQELTNAVSVAAGADAGCALTSRGNVVAWGRNLPGEVSGISSSGASGISGVVTPYAHSLTDIAKLAIGNSAAQPFGLALTKHGRIVAWGNNDSGQTNIPAGLNDAVDVAAGAFQGLALKGNGTVVAWGRGNPPPQNLSNVVAIAAGGESGRNLALKNNGTIVDWPVRSAVYDVSTPSGLSNVKAIASGGGHCLALKNDGTVVGWGANNMGQATGVPTLTFPDETTGVVFVAGQTLSNVVAIAAGPEYSLALRQDGTIVSWGHPFSMALAIPDRISNVVAIAAGEDFCLAVTTNRAVANRYRRQPSR